MRIGGRASVIKSDIFLCLPKMSGTAYATFGRLWLSKAAHSVPSQKVRHSLGHFWQAAVAGYASGMCTRLVRRGRIQCSTHSVHDLTSRDFDYFLRSFCADSSSLQISTIPVGHFTMENDSLRKSLQNIQKCCADKMSKSWLAKCPTTSCFFFRAPPHPRESRGVCMSGFGIRQAHLWFMEFLRLIIINM